MRRSALLVAALVSACGLATGCSSNAEDPGGDPSSESPDASTSATEEAPDGVELTPPGTALDVGDVATVSYEPKQGQVAVLDIKVTRLEKTSFKESFVGWNLDAQTKKTAPYFVRATVTNRGTTNVGGRPVPLYAVDGEDSLNEAYSFASTFKPCSPGTFPEKFGSGKKAEVCLVYLIRNKGDLTAVSFRPTEDDIPITWTGELQKPKPPEDDKGKGDKKPRTGGGEGG